MLDSYLSLDLDIQNTQSAIECLQAAIGEMASKDPIQYREQTRKVIASARKILQSEDQGGYTLTGRKIKMFAKVYKSLPGGHVTITMARIMELGTPYHRNKKSNLCYVRFAVALASRNKIMKTLKTWKRTRYIVPSGVPTRRGQL